MDPVQLEAFGLDPDIVHLNHGAFGVAPVVVREAASRWRERAERNPHRFRSVAAVAAAARGPLRNAGGAGPLYEALSRQRVEVLPVEFGEAGYLRIAGAPYNTADDYDRLAAIAAGLLGGG